MFLLVMGNTKAQDLEIQGSAKITNLPAATSLAMPVGRETDGTLVSMSGNPTYSIGDYAQGGVVFWVNAAGNHGRVAYLYNIADVGWSNISMEIGTSAQSDLNGAGNCVATVLQSGHTASAAKHCLDLEWQGYGDWYLPSKSELNLMYTQRNAIDSTSSANGGEVFSSVGYWSSTESNIDPSEAWNQNFFGAGTQSADSKGVAFYLRPVRAF